MGAGKYNKLLVFQQVTSSSKKMGQEVLGEYQDMIKVYGKIETIETTLIHVDKLGNIDNVTHIITCRFFHGANEKLRIRYNQNFFEIKTRPVNVNEKNKELMFKVKKIEVSN